MNHKIRTEHTNLNLPKFEPLLVEPRKFEPHLEKLNLIRGPYDDLEYLADLNLVHMVCAGAETRTGR